MFKNLKLWWYVRKLNDRDGSICCDAVRALGELGDERAVEPLIKALGDEDERIRRAAAGALGKFGEALGKLGDAHAVEPLIKALGDGDGLVRIAAAMVLGRLGDARVIVPLIKVLGDGNKNVRRAAAEALGKLGEPKWLEIVKGDDQDFARLGSSGDTRAVELLIKALGHGDWAVRIAAAQALGESRDTRAVEPLIKALSDFYDDIRRAAVQALGKLGDTRAVVPLIKALGDENGDVRRTAAEALGKLGDARAIEPLINTLVYHVCNVRRAAAEALEKLGEPKWREIIKGDEGDFKRLTASGDPRVARTVEPLIITAIKALGDGDSDVRRAAIQALGKLRDARAVKPIIKALGDEQGEVCRAAEDVLGKLGDWDSDARRAAVEPLIERLGDRDDEVLAEILGKLGDARAVEPLINTLTYHVCNVRRAAAEALEKLGEPKWREIIKGDDGDFKRLAASGDAHAAELLIKALGGSGDQVSSEVECRAAAAQALGELRDARAVEPLINVLGDMNYKPVRSAAAEALASLATVCPAAFGKRWKDVQKFVNAPHDDNSNCHYHNDTGIGLYFPDPPSGLDF